MIKILLVFLCFICLQSLAQKKIALIVAVGEYPSNSRWKNLSSQNDVKYIRAALQKNRYDDKDIETLINSNATKKNILNALEQLANKVATGDIVVFHFSGHGQQIQDNNGDEADGYDEALIPYD